MKTLNIIESAYRATIEEQDDTIVWLVHAMKGAGAELSVLLRGNAVNYAVRAQDASGVFIAAWQQTQPPRLAQDVSTLIAKGVPVLASAEDMAVRGLDARDLIDGVAAADRDAVAALIDAHPRVWHW